MAPHCESTAEQVFNELLHLQGKRMKFRSNAHRTGGPIIAAHISPQLREFK
jgi:hypothetical protein